MGDGRHVMDCLGMTRVVIEDGKVIDVGEPKMKYCPLYKKYRNIDEITSDVVKENMEMRISDFGMCTSRRQTRASDFLSFGVSEILSTALKEGTIDAAVIASDGCGTAIVTDPEIVQGLCGRISGLVETSPIEAVISAVGTDNVLDPQCASINAIRGAAKAEAMGFGKFAVTVASASDALFIRRSYGSAAIIIAVHTSMTTENDAKKYFENCDMITACGSGSLRKEAKAHMNDIVIAGNKVPVYGVTEFGKKLVLNKLKSIGREPWTGEPPMDDPSPML